MFEEDRELLAELSLYFDAKTLFGLLLKKIWRSFYEFSNISLVLFYLCKAESYFNYILDFMAF